MEIPSDEVMVEFQRIADDLARAELEKDELQGQIRQKEVTLTKTEIELKSEISRLKIENENLLQRVLKERRKAQELEKRSSSHAIMQEVGAQVQAERARFRDTAMQLIEQVEYLKTIYPFEKMLEMKEQEIEASAKLLRQVSSRHPDRKSMEVVHAGHLSQRQDICRVIQESRNALSRVRSEIDEALGPNAGPEMDPEMVNDEESSEWKTGRNTKTY